MLPLIIAPTLIHTLGIVHKYYQGLYWVSIISLQSKQPLDERFNRSLWCEWESQCLLIGSCPASNHRPFWIQAFREICPLFPLQCLREVCVCGCVLPNPLFKPHLLPLLPFLFHTLSAVLTHSFWGRPKTGRAAPQSGTPVLRLTQLAGTL